MLASTLQNKPGKQVMHEKRGQVRRYEVNECTVHTDLVSCLDACSSTYSNISEERQRTYINNSFV